MLWTLFSQLEDSTVVLLPVVTNIRLHPLQEGHEALAEQGGALSDLFL